MANLNISGIISRLCENLIYRFAPIRHEHNAYTDITTGILRSSVLPKATSSAIGAVKVDGTSITVASDGTISSRASLPAVTSADNGKVLMVTDGAWAAGELPVYDGEIAEPDYTVDISLTSPGMPADFNSCTIKAYDDTQGAGAQLATISSPTGSASVVVSGAGKIIIELRGEDVFVNEEHISCTGGVTYDSKTPHDEGPDVIFQITGNGTIILSGILW